MKINITPRTLCLFIFIFLGVTLLAKQEEKRVALIWGNSNYHNGWNPLPTCKNDAEEIEKVLRSLGFKTVLKLDLTKEEMSRSLRQFVDEKAKDADVAVFYYSGHAFVYDYNYYLVPAKTKLDINSKNVYSNFYYKSDDISRAFRVNSRLSILFFDACRNIIIDEGATKGGSYQTKVADETRFLSQKKSDSKAPYGCKICYSATLREKAQVTLENDSVSPFTRALVHHLKDDDEFNSVWNIIQHEVAYLTNDAQHPSHEESYLNEFYFNKTETKLITKPTERLENPDTQKGIMFRTNVPDAKIVFNDESFDTNKQLFFEKGYSYNYLIAAEGYVTQYGTLEKVSDKTDKIVPISLRKIEKARLDLSSTPVAEVFVDGFHYGKTPLRLDSTLAGIHSIYLYADGYKEHNYTIMLTPGQNYDYIQLKKNKPWFLDNDKNNDASHLIGYSFSPEYQYGLDYLYRFKKSRFSLGLRLAVSPSFFRGINFGTSNIDSPVSTSVNGTEVINGRIIQYTLTTTTRIPSEYSKAIDLYDEATFYSSNLLVLLNSGFNLCNGTMIEVGAGAASNQEKIKMPYFITYQKIVKTNTITGENIGLPEAKTIMNDVTKWYTGKTKWSPAARIGLRAFLPIKSNHFSISLGGGYTFVFTNFGYSSWDGNIGFCFSK